MLTLFVKFLEKKTQKKFLKIVKTKISIFFRTIGWRKVRKLQDVPTHHSQGLVFLSNKNLIDMFPKNKK